MRPSSIALTVDRRPFAVDRHTLLSRATTLTVARQALLSRQALTEAIGRDWALLLDRVDTDGSDQVSEEVKE
jgi:hypothetical protein